MDQNDSERFLALFTSRLVNVTLKEKYLLYS